MRAKYLQLSPTLCNPMDCSSPGFSVHGILQARIQEWVAISFSKESSWPRDWIRVSCSSPLQRDFLPLSHQESVGSLWENPQGSLPPTIYTLCNPLSLTIHWNYCFLLRNRIWQKGWEANVLIFFLILIFSFNVCMWDLSSPTRNWTHAPCIGNMES